MQRHRALFVAIAALLVCPAISALVDARTRNLSGGIAPPLITSVTYGTVFNYNAANPGRTVTGDGWASTWADDDKIYTNNDDGLAWGGSPSGNMMLSTLSTADSSVVGTLVNQMAAWGTATQYSGSPLYSHKWQGIVSVGGTMYGLLWRLAQSGTPGIKDGQLIKSTNHGVTWIPAPPSTAEPYASPMFPGQDIPFGFVQYGKDYTGNGPDNSGSYIYSLVSLNSSNTGGFNIRKIGLARVTIASIGAQSASDWQYWTGGDGLDNANWSTSIGSAAAVIDALDGNGGKAGTASSMQYLPRYAKYIYIADQYITLSNRIWFTYICDHPWGPCNQLGSGQSWVPGGFYFPGIIPKSVVNGGQQLVVAAAGDYTNPTYYTLNYFPITIAP